MTIQKLMSITRKGIDDFNMIPDGAKVAVGVSGGKDSLALVTALDSSGVMISRLR